MAASITASFFVDPQFDEEAYEDGAKDDVQTLRNMNRLRTPFSIVHMPLEESSRFGELDVTLDQEFMQDGAVLQQKEGFMNNLKYTEVLRDWVQKLQSERPSPLSAKHPSGSRLEFTAKNCAGQRYYVFHTDIPRRLSSSEKWTTAKVLYLLGVVGEGQRLVVPLAYYHVQHLIAIREELVDRFLANNEPEASNFHFYTTTEENPHRAENSVVIAPYLIDAEKTPMTASYLEGYTRSKITDYVLANYYKTVPKKPAYSFYMNATNWSVVKADRAAHFNWIQGDDSKQTNECTFVLNTKVTPFKASSLGYEFSRVHGRTIKRLWSLNKADRRRRRSNRNKVKITGNRDNLGWFNVRSASITE